MTDTKNITAIRTAISTAKDKLGSEANELKKLVQAEVDKKINEEKIRIKEAMEDPEKLSTKDVKNKEKRDRKIVKTWTILGGILGASLLIGAIFSPPTIAAYAAFAGGIVGEGFSATLLSSVVGSLLAGAATAVGRGVGFISAKLMPYEPKLTSEELKEIKESAQKKIETEMIGRVLCQLRLERTEGRMGFQELAEACDALADIAVLQHKISGDSVQKLKEAAQEARANYKTEKEEIREEEKLALEKEKTKKSDEREGRKEQLEDRKAVREIDHMDHKLKLETLLAEAQIAGIRNKALQPDLGSLLGSVATLFGGGKGDLSSARQVQPEAKRAAA